MVTGNEVQVESVFVGQRNSGTGIRLEGKDFPHALGQGLLFGYPDLERWRVA